MDKHYFNLYVGQVWESCDSREKNRRRIVVSVDGGLATLATLETGRKTVVNIEKFLRRQNTVRGYRLVKELPSMKTVEKSLTEP